MSEHKIPLNNVLAELAKSRDGTGHSVFGPSGSAMYLNCAGSLIPNLLHPDEAGEDAAYGTVAHGVTELWAKEGKAAARRLISTTEKVKNGNTVYEIEIDEDMLVHVKSCIDTVDMEPGEHFYETWVNFSNLTPIPNQGGTADCIIIQHKRMIVADWKFGKGVRVDAEQNTQLMLYAYGALLKFGVDFDIREIEIRIAQPRLNHFDSWTLTTKELLAFAKYAKERMHAAWNLDAPRTPGVDQCQWCNVKATCAAHLKFQERLMGCAFDDLFSEVTEADLADMKDDMTHGALFAPKPFMELTTDEMAFLLPFRGMVERWWKAMAEELVRRGVAGEPVPGYKIVESRSHRKFKSQALSMASLLKQGLSRDDLISEKMATPAEVERLLAINGYSKTEANQIVSGLTFQPPGEPTLAVLSDKRESIANRYEEAFSDLSENS